MSSLSRRIASEVDAGYGVNTLEVQPRPSVKGVSTSVVGMVALLPWGPVGEVVSITNAAEFLQRFYPDTLAAVKDTTTYPALRALLNKPLFTRGGLRVVRPAVTGADSADSGAVTAGDGSVTITARYAGALGNSISYQFTAASGGNAAERDVVITAPGYLATYKDVAFAAIASLSDALVTFSATGATAMPDAGSATALTGGTDGTVAAGDVTDAIDLFGADVADADVVFVAECPSAIVDDVNTGLKALAALGGPFVVLSTVPSQERATAITYVEDYRDTAGNSLYPWPRVKTPDTYTTANTETVVDGNAFVAAAIANVPAWLSPGGNGKLQGGVDLLAGITGLEDETANRTGLDALNDAGIAPFARYRGIGFVIRNARTTALTGRTKVQSRRYTSYLMESIAELLSLYVERPLDLDAESEQLGPVTGAAVQAIDGFLQAEVDDSHMARFGMDPFASSPADLAAGRWYLDISARYFASMDEIVLRFQGGESVTVTEQ